MKSTTILKNGLKVLNFSSPHSFTFDDGTYLAPVSAEVSYKYKVNFNEVLVTDDKGISDVYLTFELNEDVWRRVDRLMRRYKEGVVDKVIIPLPMMTVLRSTKGNDWVVNSPFRVVRIEDRVNKIVSSTKFCL